MQQNNLSTILQLIAPAKMPGFLAAARAAQTVADLLERLVDRKGTARTRKRGLHGTPRSNRHGSLNRCFRRKIQQALAQASSTAIAKRIGVSR